MGVSEPPFFHLYSETRDEYDCGRQDCQQHWRRFADEAGISLSTDHLQRVVDFETRMWLRVNPHALELAREIKAGGVRTAILSNMPHDLLGELRKSFDWLNEFEVQIWSCEHGVVKPAPEIYRLCLNALGCEPHRTLFFDDRPNNVEGARRAGMKAHLLNRPSRRLRSYVVESTAQRKSETRNWKLSGNAIVPISALPSSIYRPHLPPICLPLGL